MIKNGDCSPFFFFLLGFVEFFCQDSCGFLQKAAKKIAKTVDFFLKIGYNRLYIGFFLEGKCICP
jgi:hypothetical protein